MQIQLINNKIFWIFSKMIRHDQRIHHCSLVYFNPQPQKYNFSSLSHDVATLIVTCISSRKLTSLLLSLKINIHISDSNLRSENVSFVKWLLKPSHDTLCTMPSCIKFSFYDFSEKFHKTLDRVYFKDIYIKYTIAYANFISVMKVHLTNRMISCRKLE